MPGNINRINTIINSNLPTESAAFTRLVGTAFPLDLFLVGYLRFAKKYGNIMSTWMGDNTFNSAADVVLNDQVIYLSNVSPWITLGAKLLIRDIELVTVNDFVTDLASNLTQITISERFRAAHPAGSKVLLFGYPLQVLQEPTCAVTPGSFDPGLPVLDNTSCNLPQQIHVQSVVKLYDFDEIAIGFTTYKLQKAIFIGTTVVGTLTYYNYRLILDSNFKFPTTNNRYPSTGSTIYLRCNPSYESQILTIPTIPPSQVGFGPFCVDWLSGVVTEKTQVTEHVQFTAYDGANNPLWTQNIDKNFCVLQTNINSDAVLFWDLLRGKVNWDGSNTLAFLDAGTDADIPAWVMHWKCVPELVPGQVGQYRMQVTNPNTTACAVTITMDPYPATTSIVPANSTINVPLTMPLSGAPVQRIYIGIAGVLAGGALGGSLAKPIKLGPWYADKQTVRAVSYVIVTKTEIAYRYASTGLFAKPIFLSTEYLKARLDFDALVNNGKLVLT